MLRRGFFLRERLRRTSRRVISEREGGELAESVSDDPREAPSATSHAFLEERW